jgi:hypothetical protein
MPTAPADPKRPVIADLIPLLRLEGLAIGLAAVAAYEVSGAGWLSFALLILAPDLAMAGYAFGPRIGAIAYNAAHTYLGPVGLGVAGWFWGWPPAVPLAAIWIAHIGLDRAVGYGLKHRLGFKITHLSVTDS